MPPVATAFADTFAGVLVGSRAANVLTRVSTETPVGITSPASPTSSLITGAAYWARSCSSTWLFGPVQMALPWRPGV